MKVLILHYPKSYIPQRAKALWGLGCRMLLQVPELESSVFDEDGLECKVP